MGALQKLQNSRQTLIILWPVYPIHTNSLFWVMFEELPFCHFPPLNTFILGEDCQIWLFFHLNILVFQANGKQSYSFPVLSRFCNGLCYSFFTKLTTCHATNLLKLRDKLRVFVSCIFRRCYSRVGRWPIVCYSCHLF